MIHNHECSVDILDHDRIEVFKRDLAVVITVCLVKHQSDCPFVQVLLDVSIHLFQIVDIQITLVVAIVPLEYCTDLFLVLVEVGLGQNCLHKLREADPAGLLNIELGHDFVDCVLVRLEVILVQQ